MTARPLEIEQKLLDQQARIRGGRGAAIERLPFAVVLDNVRSLWNVGSIFRTADACGVEQMVLTGVTGCPPRRELTKTALGAEEAVALELPRRSGRRSASARRRGIRTRRPRDHAPRDTPGSLRVAGQGSLGGGQRGRRCRGVGTGRMSPPPLPTDARCQGLA